MEIRSIINNSRVISEENLKKLLELLGNVKYGFRIIHTKLIEYVYKLLMRKVN